MSSRRQGLQSIAECWSPLFVHPCTGILLRNRAREMAPVAATQAPVFDVVLGRSVDAIQRELLRARRSDRYAVAKRQLGRKALRAHQPMLAFLRAQPMRFASTLPVLTEVAHMLDFSVNAQLDFFRWVNAQGVVLVDIGQSDMARVIALTEKYADRPMDFADASLVIAAEKTGIRSIVSLDADLDAYRVTGREVLSNLWTSDATVRRRS